MKLNVFAVFKARVGLKYPEQVEIAEWSEI